MVSYEHNKSSTQRNNFVDMLFQHQYIVGTPPLSPYFDDQSSSQGTNDRQFHHMLKTSNTAGTKNSVSSSEGMSTHSQDLDSKIKDPSSNRKSARLEIIAIMVITLVYMYFWGCEVVKVNWNSKDFQRGVIAIIFLAIILQYLAIMEILLQSLALLSN